MIILIHLCSDTVDTAVYSNIFVGGRIHPIQYHDVPFLDVCCDHLQQCYP